jgi:ATP-dependent Clp protease ATP-binding subunit ClpA
MGGVEIIEGEVEVLKMMEREERIIGKEGAVKHVAREVQCSDMPGIQVTSDPIPQAAVCTLFP